MCIRDRSVLWWSWPQYLHTSILQFRIPWSPPHLKHTCFTSLWIDFTFCSGCEVLTLCWNWRIESHNTFHWNGTDMTTDAVNLASSLDRNPLQIFLTRRDRCLGHGPSRARSPGILTHVSRPLQEGLTRLPSSLLETFVYFKHRLITWDWAVNNCSYELE